jgi:exodeoxyribonuclease VII small subunit
MEYNYEESIKRLEEIVRLLEDGGLTLEKTVELFSEGTAIITACGKYLDEAEQKITMLLDNGDK